MLLCQRTTERLKAPVYGNKAEGTCSAYESRRLL